MEERIWQRRHQVLEEYSLFIFIIIILQQAEQATTRVNSAYFDTVDGAPSRGSGGKTTTSLKQHLRVNTCRATHPPQLPNDRGCGSPDPLIGLLSASQLERDPQSTCNFNKLTDLPFF